ncbi:protease modulator HflC [Paracoccus tegillarcae]|uniref:Protease modulator HflC n=1 Tax=Paracoccus tegillarcae TaxID=1529068 RepID=A0A2K9EKH5_9RHOB|nr:protease modulator HflC [Paracoccus tegillarcae]
MASLFIVDEREKALVLRLGRVVDVKEEPGLAVKVPFLDNVVKYDDRILGLPTTPLEVTPLDDRRLVVDAFARWRITDVVRFRQAVGAGGIDAALVRLEPIVKTAIREVLGSVPSTDVLSDDRTSLMNQIRDEARRNSAGLGVEIIDVRLTRTDLPEQNLSATYARMRAEREREAADEVARGNEAAQRVRAAADRTVVELTSEARKRAEIVRGEADATRNAIYADAFGRDPEFFAFSRSMQSYERALQGSNSSFVMQPDSEFFDYLASDGSEGATPQPAPSTPVSSNADADENGADGAVDAAATTAESDEPLVTPTVTDREGKPLGASAGVTLTPVPESLVTPPEEPSAVVPPAAVEAGDGDTAEPAGDEATEPAAEEVVEPAAPEQEAEPVPAEEENGN